MYEVLHISSRDPKDAMVHNVPQAHSYVLVPLRITVASVGTKTLGEVVSKVKIL